VPNKQEMEEKIDNILTFEINEHFNFEASNNPSRAPFIPFRNFKDFLEKDEAGLREDADNIYKAISGEDAGQPLLECIRHVAATPTSYETFGADISNEDVRGIMYDYIYGTIKKKAQEVGFDIDMSGWDRADSLQKIAACWANAGWIEKINAKTDGWLSGCSGEPQPEKEVGESTSLLSDRFAKKKSYTAFVTKDDNVGKWR
jgi:hypothetical protein